MMTSASGKVPILGIEPPYFASHSSVWILTFLRQVSLVAFIGEIMRYLLPFN